MLATACWTAIASIPHQRLDHPAAAAVLTAGGPVCAYSHEVPHKACRLAIPAPADFGSQHEEALGSSLAQFWVSGVFAGFSHAERRLLGLRGSGCGCPERGSQSCVTAKCPSAWRGACRRRGVSQPLLWDDLAVRPDCLKRFCKTAGYRGIDCLTV